MVGTRRSMRNAQSNRKHEQVIPSCGSGVWLAPLQATTSESHISFSAVSMCNTCKRPARILVRFPLTQQQQEGQKQQQRLHGLGARMKLYHVQIVKSLTVGRELLLH